MCDCMEKVTQTLREKTEDENGVLNAPKMPLFGEKPYLEFLYHKKNRRGEYQKKEEYIPIIINYCPFCGEKQNGKTIEEYLGLED
jgi:hypothetical protein